MDKIDFLTVLISMISLCALMVPGVLLAKTKKLKEGADSVLSALVLYGCQPVLVFMSFQKTFDSRIAINMLITAGIAFFVHFVMILLVRIIVRDAGDRAKRNCVRFASVFGNCGYMGIPFLQTLFSGTEFLDEAIIYCAVVVAVFNVLTWSVGTYMISGEKKYMSFKNAFLNPTVIATCLGLLYFVIVKQPLDSLAQGSAGEFLSKLSNSFDTFGNTVTPLAMVLIGFKLASVAPKKLFFDKWAYAVGGLKLIVMSLITMFTVAFLPIDQTVKYTLFFTLSMPTATASVMFAVQFGGDSESASVFVLLTTVLSVVTIPLTFLLFQTLI